MKKTFIALFLLTAVLCCLFSSEASAQWEKSSNKAGEQRKAEKGLRDNRYFIFFLNSTVTNYGSEEQKGAFKELVQRDIMSQFFYLKFMFYESYSETRRSQRQLIELYREFLRSDIDMTKSLLDAVAPVVVTSEDPLAREYLRLGYRETVNTGIEMGMADNYRRTLYSMRLYKYVKAVKRIKEAKKYAFYAVIRAKMTAEEKQKIKTVSYDEIDKRIGSIVPSQEINRFRTMNIDAFYRYREPKSAFDSVWENPQLDSLPDYKKYLSTDK